MIKLRKSSFIGVFFLLPTLAFISPSRLLAQTDQKEDFRSEVRGENTQNLRGNTVNTTRDREAVICSQVIPENPRGPRDEGINCPSTAVPTVVPVTNPPVGGPPAGGGGVAGAGSGAVAEAKEGKKESAPPVIGLSKTASAESMGISFLRAFGILWLLLIASGALKRRVTVN